jgi:glycosyltransferase involved in cell wall biosynthesis
MRGDVETEMPTERLMILIELSSPDTRTGAVNDALDLAQLVRPHGVVVVLCGRLDPGLIRLAGQLGITTIRGKSRFLSKLGLPLYALSFLLWVTRLLRLRPDVVHLNYSGYGPSLALAARLCRIPVASRAGGAYDVRNLAHRWIDAYVANCVPHARLLLDSPLADRVCVAGDLFRRERFDETAVRVRALPLRRAGRPCFLFLGQLVERKGLSVLVDAIARSDLDFDFWLVGGDWDEPGYPRAVREQVARLGLGDRVHLENHRPDAVALITACDALVLPSLSDARPRCVIEAMFLGRPVIATTVGGIPTLVEDGVTGALVSPSDPQALANAIGRLAASEELRRRLGDAGRRRAQAEFRPERTAQRYVELYRRLAATSLADRQRRWRVAAPDSRSI